PDHHPLDLAQLRSAHHSYFVLSDLLRISKILGVSVVVSSRFHAYDLVKGNVDFVFQRPYLSRIPGTGRSKEQGHLDLIIIVRIVSSQSQERSDLSGLSILALSMKEHFKTAILYKILAYILEDCPGIPCL